MTRRQETSRHQEPASPERLLAFSDAVVAIAMTLLILPLMESVGAVAAEHGTVSNWFASEGGSLFGFVLSFGLIAQFWTSHHAMFRQVTHLDRGLVWLTIGWLFSIVWMPVSTALTAQLPADRPNLAVYIGSLFVTSAILAATRWYLVAHPALHGETMRYARSAAISGTIVAGLFFVALGLALLLQPALGSSAYFALFVLFLAGPLGRIVKRRLGTAKEDPAD